MRQAVVQGLVLPRRHAIAQPRLELHHMHNMSTFLQLTIICNPRSMLQQVQAPLASVSEFVQVLVLCGRLYHV